MGNTHVPLAGSHPSKALAREDLPEPVGPTITIRGLGNWPKASGRRVNTSRSLVGSMMPTNSRLAWAFDSIQNLKINSFIDSSKGSPVLVWSGLVWSGQMGIPWHFFGLYFTILKHCMLLKTVRKGVLLNTLATFKYNNHHL